MTKSFFMPYCKNCGNEASEECGCVCSKINEKLIEIKKIIDEIYDIMAT